jgi:hypothetical protein
MPDNSPPKEKLSPAWQAVADAFAEEAPDDGLLDALPEVPHLGDDPDEKHVTMFSKA